ncbi:MAG: cytochrome P450 [Chloroflexota bacterium]|nr:cytochrome P450 [Chloroflexota bacterium]
MNRVPPAPKGHPLLGNIPDFTRDTLKFQLDIRQYGDIASFWFGPFRAYMVNHPDAIHQVLVTDADKMHKTRGLKRALDPILGQGLFTNDGEFWKRQRKLVQPAFHTKRIGAYARTMVDYASDTADGWHAGQTLQIERAMAELTMRIIAKTLFDADVENAPEVGHAVSQVLEDVNERLNQLVPLPRWMPTAGNRRFYAAVDRLNTTIQGFIDERRRTNDDQGDLLSMLLLAQDADDGGVMTDKQVRDEAMTLFGAGHETTAVAMTWTWYLLAQNPDVEARLHAEIDAVLGGRTPTLEDLSKLVYTGQVIKEVLRLYPPAFAATRAVSAETFEMGGYTFKQKEVIMINIYGVQRDARFFPDPDRFDPDRFSAENEKLIPKYAYLPFGGGPRVCIGNAFAMMEATLLLATLAQRFALRLAPGQVIEPVRKFTLRPKYGMNMIVTPRVGGARGDDV